MTYQETIVTGINKALQDEISAAISYHKIASTLKGVLGQEIAEELSGHGDEEFEHFKQILEFANNHGITVNFNTDSNVVLKNITTPEEAISFSQGLEQIAIADYKNLSDLAKENGDSESYEFFVELMQDEMKHFDDIADYTGQSRPLQTQTSIKSFLGIEV